MRRHDEGPKKGGLLRMGIRGIAGGIGLASESIKAHKEGKAVKTQQHEESGSTTHVRDIENEENPNRNINRTEELPPEYSEASERISGGDQYPQEKAGQSSTADEKAGPEEIVDEKGEDDLEDEWNLDEAQDEILGDSPQKAPGFNVDEVTNTFIRNNPPPKTSQNTSLGSLPLPVILPQRRPRDRSRGFIRAYAPVLENCGIDQATWLAFLDTFWKASAANPWLNAINMASIATMFIPVSGVGLAVDYAIRQATNVAIEFQARERTNTFLTKINDGFFRPRGLYCLVMTWNPESTQQVEQVNLTATIASRSAHHTGLSGVQSKFRSSDGKTYGEWEFPETAPLVFPALDQLATSTSKEGTQKKSNMAKGMTFVANYWDKRATAEFAGKHPDSVLANVPQEKFKSRYADPNHPASSGSLISFVSGGHLIPAPNSRGIIGGIASVAGQAIRGERQGSEWANVQPNNGQYDDQQYLNRYSRHYRGRGGRGGHGKVGLISTPVGAAKKLLKKNVLYLMVVNMPSEEEMAAAKAAIRP